MRVSEQVVSEAMKKAREIDLLDYGELVFKVQGGQLIRGELKQSWKAEPKDGRPKLSTIK